MSYWPGNSIDRNAVLALYGGLVTYGSLNLTEASPPQSFAEPLTVDEVKSYLKIPERSPVDSDEDDLIAGLISAARSTAEIHQGFDLVRKQWDLSLDYWHSFRVHLRTPLVSVDLVQYTDSNGGNHTMSQGTDFIIDKAKIPAIITPPYNGDWPTFTPWPSSAILIRYTSGLNYDSPFWQGPGARVKAGMRMLISHWYNNRNVIEKGAADSQEYPYAITACLEYGARVRVH